jgi:opacity protein-like surface antigen
MRSYLIAGVCATSMLLALTPLAQAADIEPVPEPVAEMGWYVSIFGGWSHAKDEEVFVSATGNYYDFVDADFDLDNGFMVGAALGASFNDWLRGEVEVSGHFHDVQGDAYVYAQALFTATYDVDGDEDALFALANLWLELPVGGFFRPYIGGGAGFGRLDVDVAFQTPGGDVSIVDDHDWGFAWQVGAGVAFEIAHNWAIDVGYRYKTIQNTDLGFNDELNDYFEGLPAGASLDDDEFEKDYKSHNILVGLRFGF